MGIRDWANQNSALTGAAALLVCIFAVGFTVCQSIGKRGGKTITAVYFYDLAAGKLFKSDPKSLAPIDVPSGATVEYRGKEMKAGLRAYVFSCSGCPADMDGMDEAQIEEAGASLAYLDRYTDDALKQHEKMQQQMESEDGVPRMPGPMMMFDTMGRLVGTAPDKPGEYPKLYNQMDERGSTLTRNALQKCSDGSYPKQCIPDS